MENSRGSLFKDIRSIVSPPAGTALSTLLFFLLIGNITSYANTPIAGKVSYNSVFIQDTLGIIYEDIDRRPARFRDRDMIDRRVRGRDIIDGDTTLTREELQERLFAPTDSTARTKHFTYRRKDVPYASFSSRKRRHPLFLGNNNQIYSRSIELDSLGQSVIIRETVDGKDVKVPVSMSLDNYIHDRSRQVRREGWERLAYEYEFQHQETRRADLGDFLGDITTIDIPMPPNPLLNIFGTPGIQLSFSGAVDIRAGFRRQTSDQTSISSPDNTRNEPDFKQDVQINVDGLVGDKLNIHADWNTQRTFEYENQLMIRYEGYDDEIIQSIEAGNVSLQTPTQFIGSSQALFGIKSNLQFGPVRMTAVASQQKGRSEELTISGGAQEQSFEIRPYDYSRNHYFVDEEYIDGYEAAMGLEPQYNPVLEITDIEVWVTRTGVITNVDERPVTAHIDLPPKPEAGYDDAQWRDLTSGVSGQIELGQFILLREGEHYSISTRTGRLTMRTQISNDQAIAVAYRRADGTVFGDFVASIDNDSTRLVLKLVRPRNLIPQYSDAWKLQLRNIYSIGGRNLQSEGFELRVEYDIPGQQPTDELEGQQLLQVFGLDQTDQSGSPNPDNRFDWRPGVTIDPARGELIFPSLRPFDDKLVQAGLGDYSFPEIYDTTVAAARNRTEKDRFRIRGQFSSAAATSYNLGFNVVEGSVRVFLGGNPLQEGTDYTVDYMLGQITIRNEAALQQGADLRISYEQNELFQMASKTLLGLRGELPFSRYTDLNFTVMTMREETLADKVRVGEEPINNTIFGIDGRTRIPMNFVTDAMNKLPFFNSMAESNLQISGEAAYIRPDRNTKRSRVDIDEGKGVAYIDDFEGARRSVPIGVNYTNWKYASPPVKTPYIYSTGNGSGAVPADSMVQHKGRAYWYNADHRDESIFVSDIWPDRQVQRGDENVIVLQVRYDPRQRGEYNYSWDLMETIYNNPLNSWGGMMRSLTGSTQNLVEENLNFIEFWAQIDGNPGEGKMYINMGQISERIIYEERLRSNRVNGIHQEDGSRGRQPTGVLNEGEDVGLDGIPTEEEREVFADWLQHYQNIGAPFYNELNDDPSGDNYYPPQNGDYSGVTGVEGNAPPRGIEAGRLPDTEDLNRNGIVDLTNSYFQYEISLDTTNAFQDNPHIIGGGHNGWYLFRIPIRAYDDEIGNPSFDNVEFFRVWFTGFQEPIHLRIAEFAFVGNQWEEEIRDDETLVISVLNKQENPGYYSPPGVRPPRERMPDGEIIEGNEQSLVLTVNNMMPNDSRQAFRFFTARSLDIFNYRSMRMFVHGDPSWHVSEDAVERDAEIFVRFGSDTSNYYEYRQPIWPLWHEKNFIHIDFDQLAAAKAVRDTATNISKPIPVENGPPGSTYRVVRNPSMTQIRYMSIGIANPAGKSRERKILNGQVWVNEMRLIDIDNSPGWAYRASSTFNLADFGTLRINMSQTDPNFHRLDRSFGTRQTSRNWEVRANFLLQKLLPQNWQRGTELPINYTRTESIVSPQYIPGTDVLIASAMERQKEQLVEAGVPPEEAQRMVEEIRVESQTVRVSDSYTAPNIRLQIPTERWYLRETINNLRFGFNYNNTYDRSPTIERRNSWSWQARSTYQLTFSRNNYVKPFSNIFDGIPLLDHYKDVRFFYSPSNFNTGVNFQRTRTDERQRRQQENRPTVRNFTANRDMNFAWMFVENAFINPSLNYRLNVASSLVHFEIDEEGRQRPWSAIMGDMFGRSGLIDFGIDNNYSQEVRLDTRPRLPALWGINRFFELNGGYSANYRWTRNLAQETLARSAGVNARLEASMTVNLKDLGNQIFGSQQQPAGGGGRQQAPPGRNRNNQEETRDEERDTTDEEDTDSESGLVTIRRLFEYMIKIPFLDYDRVTVRFDQNRNIQNSGLIGGTGLHNFWGKFPFTGEPDIEHGPSRRYQLGLASSPAPLRAPNGSLIDNFAETNRVTMRTQRQLWRGARIEFNWNYSWGFNRNHSIQTDSLGVPEIINSNTAGDLDRSFLTLPPLPGLSMLGGNLEDVIEIFQTFINDPEDERSEGEKLSAAFEEGMESFSLLRRIFGDELPRMNWNIRWDGLERFGIFDNWARRVSIDHQYSSNYTTRWRSRPDGEGKQTEMQRITMGFNPLIGINITFKELLKGNLTASTRYSTTTNYDLNYSSRIIVQSVTQEISFTASYGRRGFAVPFFGLSLSNDIDISMTYSLARNERLRYTTEVLRSDGIGQTDDGATRTSLEPRVRYVLSQRVTAAIFYRYSKITPNEDGSRTPGMTTNEAGLDINIAIR